MQCYFLFYVTRILGFKCLKQTKEGNIKLIAIVLSMVEMLLFVFHRSYYNIDIEVGVA